MELRSLEAWFITGCRNSIIRVLQQVAEHSRRVVELNTSPGYPSAWCSSPW